MALSYHMRPCFLVLGLLLAGCATMAKDDVKSSAANAQAKILAPGECGLYVWTADAAKSFTLFASASETQYFKGATEISLIEKNPTNPPSTNRKFMDETGKALRLTLLSPQDIDGGTRYKSGRLTSLTDDGWETVVPVVGLYACQPLL